MMTARFLRVGLACLLASSAFAVVPDAAVSASASRGGGLELSMSRTQVATQLGDSFGFSSSITNIAATPRSGLVAHLNIVSLSKGVYVDPEDWSSERTQYLAPLQPGQSARLSWKVESVNGGHFAVYVVVLPDQSPGTAHQGLAVSPAVDVRVTEHRTLNSGGVLPLALGVPALLGLAMLGARVRRRKG
jgi:hypothetical protein